MAWKNVIFPNTQAWPLSEQGVGPVKFGATPIEIMNLRGPDCQQSTVASAKLPWLQRQDLIGHWPAIVYRRPDFGELQEAFARIQWLNNGAADEFNPSVTFLFHPSLGLCAVLFWLSEISPSLKGVPVLGASVTELTELEPTKHETPLNFMKAFQEKYNLILPRFGLTIEPVDSSQQALPWVLAYSSVFAEEVLWPEAKASAKGKELFHTLLSTPELMKFSRKATPLRNLKKHDSEPPLVVLYDVGEGENEDEPVCIGVIEDRISLWYGLDSGSAQKTISIRDAGSAPTARAIRSMALEKTSPLTEWPKGDEQGFRSQFFRQARREFGLEHAKKVYAVCAAPQRPKLINKRGGWPDWLQYEETPLCSKCNSVENMTLSFQIASDQKWSIEDKGYLYIFKCSRHADEIHAVVHSL